MKQPLIIIVALEAELASHQIPAGIPVIYSGVGKINAAIVTYKAIQTYQPALIINFGTVGKINPALDGLIQIGKVIQRDMQTELLAPRGIVPFSARPNSFNASTDGYTCGTGDSFVTQYDAWLSDNDVDVVDMELFAIATVAQELGVCWMSYKFISDDANEVSGTEWSSAVNDGERLFLNQLQDYLTTIQ